MQDVLYRGVFTDTNVRFSYAVLTDVANTAVLAHDCDPVSAHVLCRAIGAGVLCAPLLCDGERFSLRWHYTGALRSVLVDVTAESRVRGFISPTSLLNEVNNQEDLYGRDNGTVEVVRANARKTLNSGTVAAVLGDVVDDLAYFFCLSDQLETGMVVMVGFRRDVQQPVALCQGVLIQAMPACAPDVFEPMRQRLQTEALRELIADAPLIDNHFERVAQALLAADQAPTYTITAGPAPVFHCSCSPETVMQAVRTLPAAEVRDIATSGKDLRVTCHFCAREHVIAAAQLTTLLDAAAAPGHDAP